MPYDLIGNNPKSPFGIQIRYNIWKWADILLVFKNLCNLDNYTLSNFLFCDGYFVEKLMADHIVDSIVTAVGIDTNDPIGTRMSYGYRWDKIDKILRENNNAREYSSMPGYRQVTSSDFCMLFRFINHSDGFAIL